MMKKKNLEYTYTSRSFAGMIITDASTGRNRLKINAEKWWLHELGRFKPGTPVTFILTNKRPKRTEAQNRYLWGVYYPLIAEETGEHDYNRLHELFKGKFLTEKIVPVLGENVRIKRSTTDLSVGDFCDFIANIYLLTKVMPPPTENYDLSPLKKT